MHFIKLIFLQSQIVDKNLSYRLKKHYFLIAYPKE